MKKEERSIWRSCHNISECYYHIQITVKYRRKLLTPEIEKTIKETCEGFEYRYNLKIKQIGFDGDHIHIYLQSLPQYSGGKIVKLIKSITAKEIFKKHPKVKDFLWGGEFWTDGYYIGTVSPHGTKDLIVNYIKNQGREKESKKLRLFDLNF